MVQTDLEALVSPEDASQLHSFFGSLIYDPAPNSLRQVFHDAQEDHQKAATGSDSGAESGAESEVESGADSAAENGL